MISKPMLAGTLKNLSDVQYPVLCTPKLDGIRCLKIKGEAVSRNFKPIPNKYVRSWIEKYFPDGVDGELIVKGKSFQATTSAVMRESGEPEVVYFIFDRVIDDGIGEAYVSRCASIARLFTDTDIPKNLFVTVLPVIIGNQEDLLKYEQKCLADGYEGVMLRTPDSPYKCGRSTVREGYLLKLKRFADAEAIIIGFEERMHNANEAKKDAFGRTERSSHKANMIPTGVLGAFRVVMKTHLKSCHLNKKHDDKSTCLSEMSHGCTCDLKRGIEFSIGTGMNDAQRDEFWKKREQLVGKLLKFKYQPIGVKDVPRFPVFLGLRHENDL